MTTFHLDSNDDWRKQKLEAIRSFHSNLIAEVGIPRTDFNMKMPFYNKHGQVVVGIFSSEFKKEKGFYFELITRSLDPADVERKVYKVEPSTTYEEEYELNEKGSYLVPLEELRVVSKTEVDDSKPTKENTSVKDAKTTNPPKKSVEAYKAPATMEDAPYSELTIRDFYAIHTNKPVSTKPWLNDLIKSTK
jgi:hypothetical protein